ncbi:FUSC family protein [Herbiconiux sp. 11R-BC]|uniref:FUSC family protein n=1 Tax=Herbiconiux sp. 11R-BC TaxID=3111637 RepID=UPI003BFD32D6
MSVLAPARRLVELAPHRGAHRAAARAGIAIAVPLLVLAATGHLELSLYAVFGAFTSLYGRTHTHGSRLRMQASAGAGLVMAVVIGTAISTLPAADTVVVPVAALVAGAATFLSDAFGWHPPGALFFVFALAACAAVPSDPSRIVVAFALAAASGLLAMAVSGAGAVLPAARARRPTALAVSFATAARRPGQLGTVVAVVVAVAVAGAIPTLSGLGHPYWAMVAATATLGGADAAAQFVRAGHRLLGTLLGIVLAAALLTFPLASMPLLAIGVVVVLQVGAELFVGRNYGLAMVFVTPLALLMTELAHPTGTAGLLLDRTVETVLGVAVGVGVIAAIHLARRAHRARRARARASA